MFLDKIVVTHPLLAIFDSTDRWGHSNQEQNAIRGGMYPGQVFYSITNAWWLKWWKWEATCDRNALGMVLVLDTRVKHILQNNGTGKCTMFSSWLDNLRNLLCRGYRSCLNYDVGFKWWNRQICFGGGGQMGWSNNLFLYTGDDWKDCPMDRWHLGTPILVPTEVNENYPGVAYYPMKIHTLKWQHL